MRKQVMRNAGQELAGSRGPMSAAPVDENRLKVPGTDERGCQRIEAGG